ncbi:MAG: shikimate kinase [Gammaproteobacteria bacterium]
MPKQRNNIILIGPMGSGKTSIGKKLSKMMKFDFVDTDSIIEKKTGVDIPTIFEHEGEQGFRARETKILKEISNVNNTVIGTGGGIIISADNRRIIKNLGFVVHLTANIKELVYRTEHDKNRPLINNVDAENKITTLLKERKDYYEKSSNVTISTDNYDTVKISRIIIKNFEEYEKNNS